MMGSFWSWRFLDEACTNPDARALDVFDAFAVPGYTYLACLMCASVQTNRTYAPRFRVGESRPNLAAVVFSALAQCSA